MEFGIIPKHYWLVLLVLWYLFYISEWFQIVPHIFLALLSLCYPITVSLDDVFLDSTFIFHSLHKSLSIGYFSTSVLSAVNHNIILTVACLNLLKH